MPDDTNKTVKMGDGALQADTVVTPPRDGGGIVPAPGTTIGGFRIERLIGEGAMGEVYLARQLSMDRTIALKILPSRFNAERSFSSQ